VHLLHGRSVSKAHATIRARKHARFFAFCSPALPLPCAHGRSSVLHVCAALCCPVLCVSVFLSLGRYSNASAGIFQCTACAAGSASSVGSAGPCPSCPNGTYAANTGNVRCTQCSPGMFQAISMQQLSTGNLLQQPRM
jgi:hypothetical protein